MTTRLRAAAARIGLPAWFIVIDLLWIVRPETLAIDARHYQRAATAWLGGANPFHVTEGGVPFLAGPHTLLFYAPTSAVPLAVATTIWFVIGIAAAFWIVRSLDVPIWWMAFPPLAHAIWNGNPQTLVVAFLVADGSLAAIAAVGFKVYAALALVTKPRRLVLVGLTLVALLPLVPWQAYLNETAAAATHLATAWNGSAWRFPILIPPTIVSLWLLRRMGAEWYVVPALWPATQFYYVAMALPAVVRRPLAAAALALPVPLMAPAVVMVLAVLELRRSRVTGVQPANAGTQA